MTQTTETSRTMAQMLPEKIAALQECLADLRERGVERLVESVFIYNADHFPQIRLSMDPGCAPGVVVIRVDRVQVRAVQHMGCQLRWKEVL